MRQTSEREVIVVGAGLAGLAAAQSLAQAGVDNLLVVDREPKLGTHASGRSAGLVRRLVEDPWMARLAIEGADDIAHMGVAFVRTGSLLIGARDKLAISVLRAVPHRFVTPTRAAELVPLLRSHPGTASVLETPDDGVVDVPALLRALVERIEAANGEVRLGTAVEDIRVEEGRVVGVVFGGDLHTARHVVLAVGAWSSEWGRRLGAPVLLQPKRRHIVCTAAPRESSSREWPWVWDLASDFYFRPFGADLMWSPCDTTDDSPGSATSDHEAPAWLFSKLRRALPEAAELPVTNVWAGHRTFTPDGRAFVGPDRRIRGLHWAAGLGGHGIATCTAIGRRVAWGVTGHSERIEAAYRPRNLIGT